MFVMGLLQRNKVFKLGEDEVLRTPLVALTSPRDDLPISPLNITTQIAQLYT